MNNIHATALVHKNAKLGEGVTVGPYSVIGENVVIGEGTKVHAHVVLNGHTAIGRNNEIFEFTVIGNPGQDRHYKNEKSYVEIGDNNIIRESVTINIATGEGNTTKIGNNCFLMATAHVGHNAVVSDNVTLVNGVGLGGYVLVEEKVFVGAFSPVHQFCRLGALAMIAISSPIEKDVAPYTLGAGNPFTIFGLNKVGLERNNVPQGSRDELKKMLLVIH